MMKVPPIKLAGIGLNWDEDYANAYKAKLVEMGFYAKRVWNVLNGDEGQSYVAYCHRPFSQQELAEACYELCN